MNGTNRHTNVVYGPAGCGKSTVAEFFASRFGFAYIESDNVYDDYH